MKVLKPEWFNRPALKVAEDLIGCYLVRKKAGNVKRYLINETEAYTGPEDLACHAARGRRTKRTEVLFGPAGHIYIYFTYGMHWLLNVVTGPIDHPAGVLIRGLIDEDGNVINGPARLTKALGLDGSFHGKPYSKANGLWFEARSSPIPDKNIQRTPRIGVAYAGPIWSKKKYRFVLSSSHE